MPKSATPTIASWKRVIKDIQRRARTTSGEAERAQLQIELDAASDGLRACQKVAKASPTYVTGTNLSALTRMVIEQGPEFSSRVEAVAQPHLKRCLEAELLERHGQNVRLTAAGKTAVADEIIAKIARKSGYKPRENTFVPADKRAEVLARDVAEHQAEIAELEAALALLRR